VVRLRRLTKRFAIFNQIRPLVANAALAPKKCL
jgi:hypothetical protein